MAIVRALYSVEGGHQEATELDSLIGNADMLRVTETDGAEKSIADALAGKLLAETFNSVQLLPQLFGIVGDGVTDNSLRLKEILERGGNYYFPAGVYRFEQTVNAIASNHLNITFHPDAVLKAGPIDGNGIELHRDIATAESGKKIIINWEGGTVDISEMKNSTTHPFRTIYDLRAGYESRPHFDPARQGTAAVCDGLYLHGSYRLTGSSPAKNGFGLIRFRGVKFFSGDHWINAGGDSQLFPEGTDQISIKDCFFQGAVDLGVYVSGSTEGTPFTRCDVDNNFFKNCCHGASVKRGVKGFSISNNTFDNVARPIIVSRVGTAEQFAGKIDNNFGINSGGITRLQYCSSVSVTNNTLRDAGATTPDGQPVAVGFTGATLSPDVVSVVRFEGARYCHVTGNRGYDVIPALKAYGIDYAFRMQMGDDGAGNAVLNSYNFIEGNVCRGWVGLFYEASHGGNNTWLFNEEIGSTGTSVNSTAGGSRIVRWSGRWPWFASAAFNSGSAAAPALRKQDDETTGIFFANGGYTAFASAGTEVARFGPESALDSLTITTGVSPTPGLPNKIALHGPRNAASSYGFGVSSSSFDYNVSSTSASHTFCHGGVARHKLGGNLGATYLYSLDQTPIGATTPSTVRGTTVAATASVNLPSYTVGTLPTPGTPGRVVHCSNARMMQSGGTIEGAGAGTGGLVTDNGSAWKLAGTNITAAA